MCDCDTTRTSNGFIRVQGLRSTDLNGPAQARAARLQWDHQKIPIVRPADKTEPSSSHRRSSLAEIDFGAKIASGVCACVQTMIGSAMARSRQPVAIRSI